MNVPVIGRHHVERRDGSMSRHRSSDAVIPFWEVT